MSELRRKTQHVGTTTRVCMLDAAVGVDTGLQKRD